MTIINGAVLFSSMKCIVGRKLNMEQLFLEDGTVVPVTVVIATPCIVTQVKTVEKDGYIAIQVASGKKKRVNKPLTGHLKKTGKDNLTPVIIMEFRCDDTENIQIGDEIPVTVFEKGDAIDVVGTTKGRGFQGVVKRHGFHGSPKTHGHKDQLRMPGSIGATDAQHVFKGMRMGGRMGHDRKTIKNLEIVGINSEENLLYIKGAVPGARGSFVYVRACK